MVDNKKLDVDQIAEIYRGIPRDEFEMALQMDLIFEFGLTRTSAGWKEDNTEKREEALRKIASKILTSIEKGYLLNWVYLEKNKDRLPH